MINWEHDGKGDICHFATGGMTLRDYFAGQVLTGLYAKPFNTDTSYKDLAIIAYKAADAMIAAREKKQHKEEVA